MQLLSLRRTDDPALIGLCRGDTQIGEVWQSPGEPTTVRIAMDTTTVAADLARLLGEAEKMISQTYWPERVRAAIIADGFRREQIAGGLTYETLCAAMAVVKFRPTFILASMLAKIEIHKMRPSLIDVPIEDAVPVFGVPVLAVGELPSDDAILRFAKFNKSKPDVVDVLFC